MGLLNLESASIALDHNSTPVAHAKKYIMWAGTDQVCPVYSDVGLTTMMANPLVADENGQFELCFLVDGDYKVVITTDRDKILFSQDDISVTSPLSFGTAKTFNTVSQLLADRVLGYGVALGRRRVSLGENITVNECGFTYRVLSPSASAPDVITAGGVKLKVVATGNGFDVRAFGAVGDNEADDGPAIQKALDAASVDGGGCVILPVAPKRWLTTQTLIVPPSVSLIGSARTGGTRGGGTSNHAVTLNYTGTGAAIQLGTGAVTCVSAAVEGLAIVSEPGYPNYRNFVGILAYDFRKSHLRNIYIEGAETAFCFTGEGGAVAYVDTDNLNAYDCVKGVEIECPTPLGQVSPFIQALHLGVREINGCGTGIRLGGGQQNHSRIELRAAELGACDIGILVDGDSGGKRLTWQIDGQAWFEHNTNGNIVLNAGTLYVSGDITQQDSNVSGGFIQNGGRLIPLGRAAFEDYSIHFTGFTSRGLVRAWSFVDEGDDHFHCPISGARAEVIGGGSKTGTHTRYGDGVAGDGSGGGVIINDTSIDWTADWTVGFLCYNTTNGNHLAFSIEDSVTDSSLDLSPRPGYLRVRTEDNGGGRVSDDLGNVQDNYLRQPVWYVISHDATAGTIRFHAPNGEAINEVTRAVPPALTSGGYTDWKLNGGQNSTVVIDEVLVYDRLLSPDEIMALVELRTNAVAALGRDPRGGINRRGTLQTSTDANGEITFAHGLLSQPDFTAAQITGDNDYRAKTKLFDAQNMTVVVKDGADLPLASTPVTLSWRAEI